MIKNFNGVFSYYINFKVGIIIVTLAVGKTLQFSFFVSLGLNIS